MSKAQSDTSQGVIHYRSPVASALLGAEEGDEVEVLVGSHIRPAIIENISKTGDIVGVDSAGFLPGAPLFESQPIHSKEAIDPAIVANFRDRGASFFRVKDYGRAIVEYTEAIKLDPQSAATFCDRGIAYMGIEDYDRAIADFDSAILRSPPCD
jgi:tetratricopeptide (TPR) repeat protein